MDPQVVKILSMNLWENVNRATSISQEEERKGGDSGGKNQDLFEPPSGETVNESLCFGRSGQRKISG